LLKKVDIFNLKKDIPPDPVAGKQNPASDKQNPSSEKQNPAAGREGRGGEATGGGFAGVDDGRKRAGQGIGDVFHQVKKGRGVSQKHQCDIFFQTGDSYLMKLISDLIQRLRIFLTERNIYIPCQSP
jgi:hypothetical protein